MRPFVKWPGGKQFVYNQISRRFPEKKFETYIEPFVGAGGGLVKAIESGLFKRFVANDACGELINALKQASYETRIVLDAIQRLFENGKENAEEFYYRVRDQFNQRTGDESPEQAARFVYLNLTCFNGLYRTNKAGSFNTPFGKRRIEFDADNFTEVAKTLKNVWITQGDFEKVEYMVDDKTLVYVDPPYIPLNKETSRLYGAEFNEEEQLRTARFCRRLLESGATVIASNSDARNVGGSNEFLINAYEGFKVETIEAPRRIGAKADTRKTVTELLFIGVPG